MLNCYYSNNPLHYRCHHSSAAVSIQIAGASKGVKLYIGISADTNKSSNICVKIKEASFLGSLALNSSTKLQTTASPVTEIVML
jgi:hypothetical protein